MASKLFLLFGVGAAAALLLGSGGTAHADQPGHLTPHPDGFDVNNPPADVKKLILAAATSGNTALMRSTADAIEKQGYIPQANGLRAAADAVDAAQRALPEAGTVPPASPVSVPVPGGRVTLPPVLKLPSEPAAEPAEPGRAPSGANPLAASLTAALNMADPITNGIQASPTGKVSAFQAQERERGTYTGALDGLYGPGVAMAVASYNIVPYPPFIWSKDKKKTATNKAKFKQAMLKRAGQDPTRADEWARVADMAANT